MLSDIEIARSATMQPIGKVAERLGIPDDALVQYGKHIAKIEHAYIRQVMSRPRGEAATYAFS